MIENVIDDTIIQLMVELFALGSVAPYTLHLFLPPTI